MSAPPKEGRPGWARDGMGLNLDLRASLAQGPGLRGGLPGLREG